MDDLRCTPLESDISNEPRKYACMPERTSACRHDYILPLTSLIILIAYTAHVFIPNMYGVSIHMHAFNESVYLLLNKMWWGILLGVISVGIIGTVPKTIVKHALGKCGTFNGLLRATCAGFMLDLCSHGILLVGMKLYERGASLGQTMAFLIASPWNSLSLTFILWSLIGFKWTISIIVFSLIIALISGYIFDRLVQKGVLPENPHKPEIPEDFHFWNELLSHIKTSRPTPSKILRFLRQGLKDSKMIIKWIFFGIILASLIRSFINPEFFAVLFGPKFIGLFATIIFATILEVCSEGSIPLAADMLTRAKAAGNTFAFLMTGVATDYTEILSLKETTRSWKIALFLPLITVPQVILIAVVLNLFQI